MITILAIAGSDSSGGAGIQADIKTITSLGAHAQTVITAITAQNSLGIDAIHPVPERFVERQMEAVFRDAPPKGVKIGMLFTRGAVRATVRFLRRHAVADVVLDPVMSASTGNSLLEAGALEMIRETLLPMVTVVTPNLHEAGLLRGKAVLTRDDMLQAAKDIHAIGPAVIVTGGHLEGRCEDLLYDGTRTCRFSGSRIVTPHTHGSGCVFSSALATFLGCGRDLATAAKMAHDFTRRSIRGGYRSGKGSGPVRPGFPSARTNPEPLK